MKLYEVISFNRELLRRLSSVGIRLDDCKYIDLYEEYGVCERQVYLIIARFEKDCTDISV